jgi:hypothetical protein
MGRSSRKKQDRRRFTAQSDAQLAGGEGTPKVPPAFQNVILQPTNCLINLRGRDPKQPLESGQLLVKLDRYAIVPLEHYTDLLAVVRCKGGVTLKPQEAQAVLHKQRTMQALQAMQALQNRAAPAQPRIVRPSDGDVAHVQATKVPDGNEKPAGQDS